MSVMGYAVVDIETTGLSPAYHNRIVEVGVVLLDRDGSVSGEWCTLINPQRDLGPQHIHRIQSSEVRDAPTFADIAADLAKHLAGRVVVAHNLTFDLRFLIAEYAKLGAQVPLDVDHGLCTMRLSGRYLSSPARSLAACCGSAGIDHSELHSALYDARACAELLAYCLRAAGRPEPWRELLARARQHQWPALSAGSGRTCQRRATGERPPTFLARLIDRLPRVPGGTGVYIHSTSYRWNSPLIKGNQLVNSNEYYLQYNADVRPEGYTTKRMPYFETPYFNCYGGSTSWCYFP